MKSQLANRVNSHSREIADGSRFAFGDNWARFLELLDEARIQRAEKSLLEMLEMPTLAGKTFLDIGSGSGLFSLAARRLGAKVVSFDYDPASVACTRELRERYFPEGIDWVVQEGSVLDPPFVNSLGQFDVVYSWGVLHHTGAMWDSLQNVVPAVGPDGKLFIALYNDQGLPSRIWWHVKKAYVRLPSSLRWMITVPAYGRLWGPTFIRDMIALRPLHTWKSYRSNRGMSPHRDVIDWVGGFPFEVSKPHEIFEFCKMRGFQLDRLKTCGGKLGCNEFVFRRVAAL